MLRNCPDCERDASLGARFCRTCGGRLVPESEVTAADTRHYSPEQAAAAQHAAPAATFQPPDTARLYHPPQAYPHSLERPRKSWKAIWITMTILVLMVIAGLAVTVVTVARRAAARRPVIVQVPAGGIPEGVPVPPGFPGAPHPPQGPPPPPGTEKQLTIEDLKYPGAEIQKQVSVMGQEIVEMTTDDGMDEAKDHYKEVFGDQANIIENKSEGSVVFTTQNEPVLVVTIKPGADGKLEIKAIRAGVSTIFRQNGSQAAPLREEIRRQVQESIRQAQEEARRAAEDARREAERRRQQP
ncbi:MAG TPA: zinc ribbon domain-containing protein [Blastocatellia bacterium]|nr:zinc ribbon domain-containing protein [Blastocatellia bacterium]